MSKKAIAIAIALLAVPVLAVGWYLFRPETALINKQVSEQAIAGTMTLAKGEFMSDAHETSGTAEIVEKNGKTYVRLSNFMTSNGPDVRILLVKGTAKNTEQVKANGYLDLGALKGNVGDQNYMVPAGTNLEDYKTVSVWCRRFAVNFGAATL